nr:hypothetical protein 39 [bacterium]
MSTDIKEIRNIVEQARAALKHMENGQKYPAPYVVERFVKAANKHPTDQLIGNMRDVLVKRCSRQNFFTQKELTACYDRMYGLSGGQTAFRDELGDLLLDNHQLAKVAYSASSRRGVDESRSIEVDSNTDLSNAFASLFDLGNDNSFGLYNPKDKKDVEKVVITKLNSMGMQPNDVVISESNEHFALATAVYNTNSLNKVAVHIPVPISGGQIKTPTSMISDGEVTDLCRANLLVHLKMGENQVKTATRNKYAGQHGSAPISMDKPVMPAALMDYADLENELVVAASNYSRNQILMATNMLATEFKAAGVVNPQIKVASSDKGVMVFDVSIPTAVGRSMVHVPVEFHNDKPILPSRFAAASTEKEEVIYDFTYENVQKFVRNANIKDPGIQKARETGELSKMSYHQLVDRMIEGVANEDYKLAEDALACIQDRFGPNKHKVALDEFANLLKISSSASSTRAAMVKEAFRRGDLITISTSVEPYCPKLGLPLSKVDFDEQGRPYPKYRNKTANNNREEPLISTSRIIFT